MIELQSRELDTCDSLLARGIPIFICGHPKSGTTLLTALLDGHSQLVVFPEETFYLDRLVHQPDFTVEAGVKWLLAESACKNLALGRGERELDGNFDYSDLNFDAFQKQFQAYLHARPQVHSCVLESLVSAYAACTDQVGKRYWVEKTPGNERHLGRLVTWHSDLRAIYIVRDPRDVYVSYARKKQIESDGQATLPLEDFVCRWGMSIWAWQQFIAKHPNGLLIRYEDLLRYPQGIITLVCRFLDIEYEPILETPTKNSKLWRGNSMYGEKFTGISTRPIGRWRKRLPKEQLTVIEAYLGKAMGWFGYQLATKPPSPSQMVGCWLRHRRKKKQIVGMLIRLYWPFQLPKRLEWRRT